MSRKNVRILNFDSSITRQKTLIEKYAPDIVDLTDIGPAARMWFSDNSEGEINRRLDLRPPAAINLLGSGDFHHVSRLLIERIDGPLCVIGFDMHPDWDILPPRLACGSWVNGALENRNVLKFLLIGASSDDLSAPWIESGNIGAFRDGRLEIYPYSHAPSYVFFRDVPENLSVIVEKMLFFRRIWWTELAGKNMTDFFRGVLERLPSRKVYVTIDKDCLKREYAFTNWEAGRSTLEEVLSILRLIKEKTDIVGADITGDYSPVRVKGVLKKMASYIDHPKGRGTVAADDDLRRETNESTNLRILEALS
ncbi:MAG: arginase family protein [Candidatus Omnitrophota bacterium]